jgi:hypothetical protein
MAERRERKIAKITGTDGSYAIWGKPPFRPTRD